MMANDPLWRMRKTMMANDPLSPPWENCKVCGGDHWTKDHMPAVRSTRDTPEAALAAVVKAEEWRLANHPDDHWHEYGVAEFGPPSSGKCVPMLQVIRSLNAILAALDAVLAARP